MTSSNNKSSHKYKRILIENFLLIIFCILLHAPTNTKAIQSNFTCAPIPRDKRQYVCMCAKQLQLRCTFNLDIREIGIKDLDSTLRPIFYNDVTLDRLVDQDDQDDPNLNFNKNKLNNKNKIYLYFPNFHVLNSPYTRITLLRFIYVPSYAFNDNNKLLVEQSIKMNEPFRLTSNSVSKKKIDSIVFELEEVYDFGIDRMAFYGVDTESLLIEGPFNQMTFHRDSFIFSKIQELTIGCYCIECESYNGNCMILFNQNASMTPIAVNNFSKIKSIKLYGTQIGSSKYNNKWNVDDIPSINTLEHLEISNSIMNSKFTLQYQNEIELKSNKNLNYYNLNEFVFKNNGMKHIAKSFLSLFPNLKLMNLAQNQINSIEYNAFERNEQLVELNLERNRLKRLSKITFSKLKNLKILTLKENSIDSIEDFSFQSLEKLELLDLTRNKLTSLTENTFAGLENLKELYLSYNPFKRIDKNSFRYLSLKPIQLKRIDIISNPITDWFVFEENDICLLAHFKCETQINIDIDQRCNCFLKYANAIARPLPLDYENDQLFESKESVNSNEETNLFRPCSFEPKNSNENLQRAFSTQIGDSFEDEDYLRDSAALLKKNILSSPLSSLSLAADMITCSKKALALCYSGMNQYDPVSSNNSCLYNKFLIKRVPTTTTTSTTTSTSTSTASTIESTSTVFSTTTATTSTISSTSTPLPRASTNSLLSNSDQQIMDSIILGASINKPHDIVKHKSQNINKKGIQQTQQQQFPNSNSLTMSSLMNQNSQTSAEQTYESKMRYILICMTVIALISVTSLAIGIYLVFKKNTISYHPTDSTYPSDELK